MIKPRRPALEKRRHDDDAAFPRHLAERLRGRPGNLLRQLEVFVILDLAEILRAEQLRETDHVRSFLRRFAHHLARMRQVRVQIGTTPHLNDAEDGGHFLRLNAEG
jgi:hypothetical protein